MIASNRGFLRPFINSDLILRSIAERCVSKDGRLHGRACCHPSRRALRALLRMRAFISSHAFSRAMTPVKYSQQCLTHSARSLRHQGAVGLPVACGFVAGGVDEVAPVLVAIQRNTGPQGFELAHDLAAIAASDSGHELLEMFRSVVERRPDRGETPA